MTTKNHKNTYVLALDIGGTYIKSAIISSSGQVLGKVFSTPVNARGTSEEILSTFFQAVQHLMQVAEERQISYAGLGIAICGPFDYKNGISLMKRDKYVSLYGVNIKQAIAGHFPTLDASQIHFTYDDAQYFLLGEVWYQGLSHYHSIMGITLGTGIGAALMRNNQIVWKEEHPHSVGRMPYRKGVVEDYLGQ